MASKVGGRVVGVLAAIAVFVVSFWISRILDAWVEPYLPELILKLPLMNHDGLKRHALRIIARMPFPEALEATLMNIAFEWLLSATESVAVKMYSMQILYRLSASEPDILQELYDTIEFQLADGTPGFKSIGHKMMEQIDEDIIRRKRGQRSGV